MKSIVTAALALAYAQFAFGFTVNTPMNVVQCQPVLITWADGTPPYFPSIIPGGQPSAPALKNFDTTKDQSLTWVVDVGGSITIALKDSTGATAYTDIVNVQSGSDMSCMNGGSSTGAVSAPASAPAVSGASSAPASSTAPPAAVSGAKPTTAPAPASNASSAARPSVTGSQAAAASARPSSGAVRTSVTYGLTGVLAIVGVALV